MRVVVRKNGKFGEYIIALSALVLPIFFNSVWGIEGIKWYGFTVAGLFLGFIVLVNFLEGKTR